MSVQNYFGDSMHSIGERLASIKARIKNLWGVITFQAKEKEALQAQLFDYAQDIKKLLAERDLSAMNENDKKAAYQQLERFNQDFMILVKQKETSYKALALAKRDAQLKSDTIRDVLNAMTDSIITINENGQILSFNKASEKLFDFKEVEAIWQKINMLMPECYPEHHDNYLKKYFDTDESEIIGKGREIEIKTKENDTIPVYLSISELPLDINNEKSFLGTLVDLRERKAHENDQRRAAKMDVLGKLTSGIAHDYNNMLGIILGYTEILGGKLDDRPDLKKYLDQILHAGRRSSELTSKLLGFSKSKISEPSNLDINRIIVEQKLVLERTLTPSINITYLLEPSPWLSLMDEGDFGDVLLNLSINAKHAMADSGELIIKTYNKEIIEGNEPNKLIESGKYIVFSISDNGHGMDNKTLENIFEPFFSTKGELGTGLGLAQVYGFIQRTDGYIDVESSQGKGTTFYLYFKASQKRANNKTLMRSNKLMQESQHRHASLLVVDDEEALASMAKEILESNGYQVDTANNGNEAILLINDKGYDLVISDIVMPGLDGFTLKETIDDTCRKTKVLLTSGYSESEKAKNYSGKIMSKPYSKEKLLKHVASMLDSL